MRDRGKEKGGGGRRWGQQQGIRCGGEGDPYTYMYSVFTYHSRDFLLNSLCVQYKMATLYRGVNMYGTRRCRLNKGRNVGEGRSVDEGRSVGEGRSVSEGRNVGEGKHVGEGRSVGEGRGVGEGTYLKMFFHT